MHNNSANNLNNSGGSNTNRKRKRNFSEEEDKKILEGYKKFGNKWEKIISWAKLDRNSSQVRGRYARLNKKLPSSNSSSPPPTHLSEGEEDGEEEENDEMDDGDQVRKKQKLDEIFKDVKKEEPSQITTVITPLEPSPLPPPPLSAPLGKQIDFSQYQQLQLHFQQLQQHLQQQIQEREKEKEHAENLALSINKLEENIKQKEQIIVEKDQLLKQKETSLQQLISNSAANNNYNIEFDRYKKKVFEVLKISYTHIAEMEKEHLFKRSMDDSSRLGRLLLQRSFDDTAETWEDGYDFKNLSFKLSHLSSRKNNLEMEKKKLTRQKISLTKQLSKTAPPSNTPVNNNNNNNNNTSTNNINNTNNSNNSNNNNANNTNNSDTFLVPSSECLTPEELAIREEIIKLELSNCKKEETELLTYQEKLYDERLVLHRHLKLISDQEKSRFNSHPVLNERYLLLNLLGKGGFSEVYKVFISFFSFF